jgi:23S rRNA pseudouridine2605 synthase
MQFFEKMRERLYPVGRLDYMSEGLLLVTNDGELANKLTKASAGVEKTYLVKVAGIPSEAELDVLRAGVAIEKGKPGSDKVRTSPARIRQVRQGDNPWYEVVLIEGRNRELRKMFEEIGHFVEKIRRVGYGPLILDQEPGHLRELDAQELELLRKAADGKLRTPKSKEIRRRNLVDSLPPEKPAFKARGAKPAAGPKDYKPKRSFGEDRPVRSGAAKFGPAKFGSEKPGAGKFGGARPADGPAGKPAWKKDDRAARPPARFEAAAGRSERPAGRTFGARPAGSRPLGSRPGGKPFGDRTSAGRNFPAKPAWKKPEHQEWPQYHRPPGESPQAARRPGPEAVENLSARKPTRLHIEPVQDFGRSERARPEQARPEQARGERARPERSGTGRPPFGRAGQTRPTAGRSDSGRTSSARPFRSEGGLARPFTSSSGKPRAGGARPSSKPYQAGKPAGRTYGTGPKSGSESRPGFGPRPSKPYATRPEGASESRPSGPRSFAKPAAGRGAGKTGSGWKPKPSFGGKPKPGGRSKSPSKSGSRPGGKRSGPPGGKRRP